MAVDNGLEISNIYFSSTVCSEISEESIEPLQKDEEYINEIIALFQVDQGIRRGGSSEEMQAVDSKNIERLLYLIDVKGYPSSELVGADIAKNAFIIILHFDSDIGNVRLGPIIEKAYHEGKMTPDQYAWIIDRRLFWGPDKVDPYYYQLPSEKYFSMSAEEISAIDARRSSIGLRPLSALNISKQEGGGIMWSQSY